MNDPIADLLTRIKNAYLAGRQQVTLPASRLKRVVAETLAKHGYVTKVSSSGSGKQATLAVDLRYINHAPAVTEIKRVSKPGRRIYKRVRELPRVLGKEGLAIVSTSKGVMSHQEAKKQHLGGEVIAVVW